MDGNTIGSLIYFGMAIVVAIISATIMRVKGRRFDIGDAFLCLLLGLVCPITVLAGVVYLASALLYGIIEARERKLK